MINNASDTKLLEISSQNNLRNIDTICKYLSHRFSISEERGGLLNINLLNKHDIISKLDSSRAKKQYNMIRNLLFAFLIEIKPGEGKRCESSHCINKVVKKYKSKFNSIDEIAIHSMFCININEMIKPSINIKRKIQINTLLESMRIINVKLFNSLTDFIQSASSFSIV